MITFSSIQCNRVDEGLVSGSAYLQKINSGIKLQMLGIFIFLSCRIAMEYYKKQF